MIKKIYNNNILKRKNIRNILKEEGIIRIKPETFFSMERFFEEELKELIKKVKEKMIIQGKKVLDRKTLEDSISY